MVTYSADNFLFPTSVYLEQRSYVHWLLFDLPTNRSPILSKNQSSHHRFGKVKPCERKLTCKCAQKALKFSRGGCTTSGSKRQPPSTSHPKSPAKEALPGGRLVLSRQNGNQGGLPLSPTRHVPQFSTRASKSVILLAWHRP